MKFTDTHCCAIQEISGLRMHKTPEEAMEAFCKANLDDGTPLAFKGYRCQGKNLFSFYMFTGSVPIAGRVGGTEYVEGQGFQPLNKDYGPRFAEFIRTRGFGSVTESPAIPNKAFHPDHANVIWIWAPDRASIEAWWTKRKADKMPKGYVTDDKSGIAERV